jgi:hypothetical protein
MKTFQRRGLITCLALLLCTLTAGAQIRSSRILRVNGSVKHLQEIDFENLLQAMPDEPPLPNPLTIDGVTFTEPATLQAGFCSSPSCIPDPDNPLGGNVELLLTLGSTISFERTPRRVVLDIQGMGDALFDLLFTDTRGRTRRVEGRGVPYGRKLVGVFSNRGISRIEVLSSDGPLVLARVLYSTK